MRWMYGAKVVPVAVGLVSLAGIRPGNAGPILREAFMIDGTKIYRDHRTEDTYYLHPMPARIAKNASGQPEIGLTLTYYTGSKLRDDADRNDVRWALRIGLDRDARSPSLWEELRKKLASGSARPIVLRNLPIRRVPVTVVYAPIDTPEERFELSAGWLEESKSDGTYWTQRTINLELERNDGAVLRAAFENEGAILDIAYTYVADGYVEDDSGSEEPPQRRDDASWNRVTEVVDSDALSVETSTASFPNVFRVVDLDSTAPPGYPGLAVICTDFLEDRADWRFEQTEVRLEAQGVTGEPIRAVTRFPLADPEVSLQRVAFSYAVRVDEPFRYQVRAYDVNGVRHESKWTEVSEWSRPLVASASGLFDVHQGRE